MTRDQWWVYHAFREAFVAFPNVRIRTYPAARFSGPVIAVEMHELCGDQLYGLKCLVPHVEFSNLRAERCAYEWERARPRCVTNR